MFVWVIPFLVIAYAQARDMNEIKERLGSRSENERERVCVCLREKREK